MVAITSADTTLAGKCLQIEVQPFFVSSAGVVVEVMCYNAPMLDHHN